MPYTTTTTFLDYIENLLPEIDYIILDKDLLLKAYSQNMKRFHNDIPLIKNFLNNQDIIYDIILRYIIGYESRLISTGYLDFNKSLVYFYELEMSNSNDFLIYSLNSTSDTLIEYTGNGIKDLHTLIMLSRGINYNNGIYYLPYEDNKSYNDLTYLLQSEFNFNKRSKNLVPLKTESTITESNLASLLFLIDQKKIKFDGMIYVYKKNTKKYDVVKTIDFTKVIDKLNEYKLNKSNALKKFK